MRFDTRVKKCHKSRSPDLRFLDELLRIVRSQANPAYNNPILSVLRDIRSRLESVGPNGDPYVSGEIAPLARGREPVTEKSIRQLSAEYDWERQHKHFERLRRSRTASETERSKP